MLRNIEFCSDTRSALQCIETLGARVTRIGEPHDAFDRRRAAPAGAARSASASRVFRHAYSPPSLRSAARRSPSKASGTLLRRPMEMMIRTAAHGWACRVRDNGGFLPFEVRGPIRGGEVDVDGSVSSQFITGLHAGAAAGPTRHHDPCARARFRPLIWT